MARHFVCTNGKSNKFWEISVEGRTVEVRFGRVGTTGQTLTKEFASKDSALAAADKQVEEKARNGYVETAAAAAPEPAKRAAAAPKQKGGGASPDRQKQVADARKLLAKNDADAVRPRFRRTRLLHSRRWRRSGMGLVLLRHGELNDDAEAPFLSTARNYPSLANASSGR